MVELELLDQVEGAGPHTNNNAAIVVLWSDTQGLKAKRTKT